MQKGVQEYLNLHPNHLQKNTELRKKYYCVNLLILETVKVQVNNIGTTAV